MGSLMAGWDSHSQDPKAVTYQRNSSLTRQEIDDYWKLKQKPEEEHLRENSGLLSNIQEGSAERFQRSKSLPLTDGRGSSLNNGSRPAGERIDKTSCWWTRSNWAFLNEPPMTAMEGPTYRYASQYHVTDIGSSNTVSNSTISTQTSPYFSV